MPPVIEKLRRPDKLRATADHRDAKSYTRKFPDRIAAPDQSGGAWGTLSRALRDLNPQLGKYLGDKHKRQSDEVAAKGKGLFNSLEENKMAWKDFITQHPQYVGANPHLQRGYEQAHLDFLGTSFTGALKEAYNQQGVRNQRTKRGEDPSAPIARFMKDFTSTWREQYIDGQFDDLMIAEVFDRHMVAAQKGMMTTHTAYRMQDNVQEYLTVGRSGIAQKIENAASDYNVNWTHPDVKSLNMDALSVGIANDIQQMVDNGVPKHLVNRAVIDAVATQARNLKDEDVFLILDKIDTGNGKLSGLTYATQIVEGARKEIKDEMRDSIKWDRQLEQWAEQDARDTALTKAFTSFGANPHQNIRTFMSENGITPKLHGSIVEARDAVLRGMKHTYVMSPQDEIEYLRFQTRLRSGENIPIDDILKNTNKVWGIGESSALLALREDRGKYFNSQVQAVAKVHATRIFKYFGVREDGVQTQFDDVSSNVKKAIEAVDFYEAMMMKYVHEYQKANDGEMPPDFLLKTQAREIYATVINEFADPGKGTTHTSDQITTRRGTVREVKNRAIAMPVEDATNQKAAAVDWTATPFFETSADFKEAFGEFQRTGSGDLVRLANHYGVDATEMAIKQAELWGAKPQFKSFLGEPPSFLRKALTEDETKILQNILERGKGLDSITDSKDITPEELDVLERYLTHRSEFEELAMKQVGMSQFTSVPDAYGGGLAIQKALPGTVPPSGQDFAQELEEAVKRNLPAKPEDRPGGASYTITPDGEVLYNDRPLREAFATFIQWSRQSGSTSMKEFAEEFPETIKTINAYLKAQER